MSAATALSAVALSGAAPAPARLGWPLCAAPPAPAGPPRLSLPAFSADQKKVDALRRGIAAMKALPASDHRSYFFQAATHAYNDELLRTELRHDPKLKTVNKKKYWNQCPHFGQSSADFVVWHRAYLHFFERTLRAAAQDDSLSLPYWDYSKPEQRTFPAIYTPEFLDDKKKIPNPLFHPNREKSFTKGLVEVSALVGVAEKTMAATTFFHETGSPGLGGDGLGRDSTQIGLLEQRPHNDIHLAVGGVINSANGAMAEIITAAFDPVFWAHHANVDRLWAEWASRAGKSWGKVPGDEWFDARPWIFIDADGSEVHVSRREAIGMLASYDVDYPNQLVVPMAVATASEAPGAAEAAGAALAAPAPVAAAAPPMVGAMPPPPRRGRPVRRPAERELLADHRPMIVTPHNSGRRLFGEPLQSTVHGDVSLAREGAPEPTLVAPELTNVNAKVLLELSDISFKLVPSSGFAVYLDAAGRPPGDPVGLIDIFGATHHDMSGMTGADAHHMKAAQRFDVTAVVRNNNGPFAVRVEAYDVLVTRDGKSTRGRADPVEIGSVRFVVIS